MTSTDHAADAAHNRELWTLINGEHTDADASRSWSTDGLCWGLFSVPETQLRALGDVAGRDVLEIGCGTAYVSAHLARAGARPVGVDVTPAQLDTARRCQERFGLSFPLVEADATDIPLPDASFDLVVSEYGACLWCDPEAWVPEAARLLRPHGRLVFLTNSMLAALCVPDGPGPASQTLQRPLRTLGRVRWEDGGIENHLSHGRWVELLTRHGFVIDALHELYAPDPTAAVHEYYDIVTPQWASQWPAEDLWVAHLR
jgi:SAM-dependent methyltransferase